jgi:hypothetical protein
MAAKKKRGKELLAPLDPDAPWGYKPDGTPWKRKPLTKQLVKKKRKPKKKKYTEKDYAQRVLSIKHAKLTAWLQVNAGTPEQMMRWCKKWYVSPSQIERHVRGRNVLHPFSMYRIARDTGLSMEIILRDFLYKKMLRIGGVNPDDMLPKQLINSPQPEDRARKTYANSKEKFHATKQAKEARKRFGKNQGEERESASETDSSSERIADSGDGGKSND